jgi:hypothetical protein
VFPVLLEYLLVAQAVDAMGHFAKALETAEIVEAIHIEYSGR